MSVHTEIGWCDSTVNAQMGCDGCELSGEGSCYAEELTAKWAGKKGWPPAFNQPTLFPGRIAAATSWPDLAGTTRPDKPWLDGLPRLIFLDDMGDTFTETIPLDWLAPQLPIIAASPHWWLVLTKRPHRLATFAQQHPLPRNVWIGTSILERSMLGRVKPLLDTAATIHFLSLEPLWGLVDIAPVLATGRLDWVIVGGHSGKRYGQHVMELAWVRAIAEACTAFGVPLFLKQDSARLPGRQGRLPAALWARKEMPTLKARHTLLRPEER